MMMFSCLLKIYNHENSEKIDEFLDSYSYCRSKSLKELNEANFFGGLTVLENKELLTEKLEELKEDLKDYLESDNQNSKTITFIKEEIERIENNIRLIRIPYWKLDNIEKILDEEFDKLKGVIKRVC